MADPPSNAFPLLSTPINIFSSSSSSSSTTSAPPPSSSATSSTPSTTSYLSSSPELQYIPKNKRFQNEQHNSSPPKKKLKLDNSQFYFSPRNILTHIPSYNGGQSSNEETDRPFNHWCYSDYADEILDILRLREKERKLFYYHSPQVEYRQHFVHFIRKVALAEKLYRSTVHLAIYILDTFMDNHRISSDRLRLVALCSLLLAAKIEDHDPKIPKIKDLNNGIGNQYPLSDYTALERLILKFFDFKLLIPTAATFVEIFIEEICNEEDFQMQILMLPISPSPSSTSSSSSSSPASSSLMQTNNNCYPFTSLLNMKRSLIDSALEMLDLTLFDINMVQELPSRMAAACLAAARKLAQLTILWPEYLQKITHYKLNDIENCVNKLINFSENQQNEMTIVITSVDCTDENNNDNNNNEPLTIDIEYHSNSYRFDDQDFTPDSESVNIYDTDDSIEIE